MEAALDMRVTALRSLGGTIHELSEVHFRHELGLILFMVRRKDE